MIEEAGSNMRVEALKASHFSMLENTKGSFLLRWLQSMLLRNWLSGVERALPGLFPTRQSVCLVGIESQKLIAYIVASPYNRRGSCWAIALPTILTSQTTCSTRELRQCLINNALEQGSDRVKSWVLRCPAIDSEQIAISRELGFQSFRVLQSWTQPLEASTSSTPQSSSLLPEGLEWQPISRITAQLLWSLEKASCSSHLRQIIDRQWIDLLENDALGSGVLINKSVTEPTAIAGLISRKDSQNKPVLELVRGIAWDYRLVKALKVILNNLISVSERPKIETANEDDQLNQLLEQLGWQRNCEEVLFGRSLWRRQSNKQLIKGARQFEAILGQLQPQNPPLPTPTLGKR